MSYHFADIPNFENEFPQFDYPVKATYKLNNIFYEPDEIIIDEQVSYETFIEKLWKVVCEEFDIEVNLGGALNRQVSEIDEFIAEIYGEKTNVLGVEYDTSDVLYRVDGERYNFIAYDWVENQVVTFLENLIEELDNREVGEIYEVDFYWAHFTFMRVDELEAYNN